MGKRTLTPEGHFRYIGREEVYPNVRFQLGLKSVVC